MAERIQKPIDIFNCTEQDLCSIHQVGQVTAQSVLELVQTAAHENRDIVVDELSAIGPKVQWQKLVDSGLLLLKAPSEPKEPTMADFMRMMNARFDRLETRLWGAESKVEQLFDRTDSHEAAIQSVMNREQSQREHFDVLTSKIESQEKQMSSIFEHLDRQRVTTEQLKIELMGYIVTHPPPQLPQFSFQRTSMRLPPSTVDKPPDTNSPAPSQTERDSVKSPERDPSYPVLAGLANTISEKTRGGVYVKTERTEPTIRSSQREISRPSPPRRHGSRPSRRPSKSPPRRRSSRPPHRSPPNSPSSDAGSPDRRRRRSKSPQGPRMQTFSGDPKGVKFDVFLAKFRRVANRRGWNHDKKLDRFFDCLTGEALEYANRSLTSENFDNLIRDMSVRFDYRDEPMAARQKMSAIKQETETEEEFLQKIQSLANDGYRNERDIGLLNRLTTEAFLRGLKNKEAALDALGRHPQTMQEALKLVKAFCANAKVLGLTKQVSFEQKAVSVLPEDSVQQLSHSILRGMENLLKTHLDPRSRSPSPYSAHSESESSRGRGRPHDRYRWSDRDSHRRSPESYSDSRGQRRFTPSPRRDGYGPNYSPNGRDRYQSWDRRSPRRDYRSYPNRGYRDSPVPNRYRDRDSPSRYEYRHSPVRYRPSSRDRGTGQPRHKYETRSVSPVTSQQNDPSDLNSEGLIASTTSN